MLFRRLMLAVAILAPMHSQPSVDPDALLRLAAERINEAVDRQPRFSCDATVSRELYRSALDGSGDSERARIGMRAKSLTWKDRLHVEVGFFNGRQLHSWPGGDAFRFEGLNELTGEGASGTGDFGPFAASFLSDSDPASIKFRGVGEWKGHQIAQYSYDVPLVSSHYEVNTGPHRFERTAYHGELFVDVQTGDLRRLIISVTSPPVGSDVVRADVDASYEPQAAGAGPDLYPVISTLKLVLQEGAEAVNRTTYRSCRSFSSESVIHFDDRASSKQESTNPLTQPAVPAGLEVKSVMLNPIDSRTASAGDLFEARVVDPVRQGKETVIPKGAVLHGRIVEMAQRYYPRISVLVMLKFSSVDFDGNSKPVALGARAMVPLPNPLMSPQPRDWTITPRPLASDASDGIAIIHVFGTDHVRFDTRRVMLWETR